MEHETKLNYRIATDYDKAIYDDKSMSILPGKTIVRDNKVLFETPLPSDKYRKLKIENISTAKNNIIIYHISNQQNINISGTKISHIYNDIFELSKCENRFNSPEIAIEPSKKTILIIFNNISILEINKVEQIRKFVDDYIQNSKNTATAFCIPVVKNSILTPEEACGGIILG